MTTRRKQSILDGWLLPIVVALLIIAGWSVYDATTLEISKDPKHAKGLRAFNTFMTAATRVAEKTGDKWVKEIVRSADYYTEVRAASDEYQTVVRKRSLLSSFILVGYVANSDLADSDVRDTVQVAAPLGMITKDNGSVFIHESAAEAKPNYLRGLLFLHGINESVRHGGTRMSLLINKHSMADEVKATQEMLNLAGLIGGEQYRKAVEDAALFSSVGVEDGIILSDFHREVAALFEAETPAERYAVNQLFVLHIAFKKAEEKWQDDQERMILEKYEITKKVADLIQRQDRARKGTSI